MKLNIDFSKVFNSISFQVGGHLIDKLHDKQINIYQHKYNAKTIIINETIIFPLPFNCMLKENGVILQTSLKSAMFYFDMSNYEINKYIETAYVSINVSKLDNNFDMSKMTNYYYKQMIQTKFYQDSLIKINGSCPSDFASYYLISSLFTSKKEI